MSIIPREQGVERIAVVFQRSENCSKLALTSKETNTMMKTKKKFAAISVAALSLLIAGVAGFAQKHFMLSNAARPEVKMQLSASVERDSALVPLDKSTVVKPGEILEWTIVSENSGNAAALGYKAVGHIPQGTSFVSDSAKADGAKTFYSIDGKSFSAQPMIEEKQADGSVKRVPAPVAMYTEIRYEWSDPLAQGGKLSASYRVRVK
jgi:uncharacterized repeat protein (TIGR01451 family)